MALLKTISINTNQDETLDTLIYPREHTLSKITLVLGLVAWLVLILGTVGVALAYVLAAFIAYVFAQSAWVASIRGNALQLSAKQYPDLHERLEHCCKALNMDTVPETYILNGNGLFNAFATRFFGRNFVVLMSDVVDAMEQDPDGINFYIGHELGHIRLKHLTGHLWRMPVLWLPLLGAAYSRAKEYSCDRHGTYCCPNPDSAARALLVLAAGAKRWQTADLRAFGKQLNGNLGFFASFHELIGGYPWLIKRVTLAIDANRPMPGRNPLAYVLAFFVPFGGRAGGGAAGLMIVVATVGILAAVALPAYQDYTQRAAISQVWTKGSSTRATLTDFYAKQQKIPASFEEAGLNDKLPDGSPMTLNAENMVVNVTTPFGTLVMTPRSAPQAPGGLVWKCAAGEGLKPTALPANCK